MTTKTAIITGAARGIGFGIAACLARKGVNIVIADINGEAATKSAAALAEETNVETLGVACDITQRSQVAAMVQAAQQRFSRIDILVNNAGICPFIDIMEISEDVFKRTIDVNLNGAFHCTQLAGRAMFPSAIFSVQLMCARCIVP